MSIPELPGGLSPTQLNKVANQVHSVALRLLRSVRTVDVEIGLSGPRASLLSVLVFAGPRSIGELSAIEQVSGPAITKMVDGLVAEGLARRSFDPTDRRISRVSATAAGKRRLEAGRARRVQAMARLLDAFDESELAEVDMVFARLATRLS